MRRAHSNAYLRVNQLFDATYRPALKAVAARAKDQTEAFGRRWGWERAENDWCKLVDASDIDAIDICSPNNTHHEIACATVAAWKMILCEKPLAIDFSQGREMTRAVEQSGRPNMVWFNYRRAPAVTLARQIIDEGSLEKIFHTAPLTSGLDDFSQGACRRRGSWRLDKDVAGTGVCGDISTHTIDTALWLNGSITRVCGMTKPFIRQTGKFEVEEKRPASRGENDALRKAWKTPKAKRRIPTLSRRRQGTTSERRSWYQSTTWSAKGRNRCKLRFDVSSRVAEPASVRSGRAILSEASLLGNS